MKFDIKKVLFIFLCTFTISFTFACGENEETITPEVPTPEVPTPEVPTPEVPIDDDSYTVQVTYPDGTYLTMTSNVMAQWCIGDVCLTPVLLDAEGYAKMKVDETYNGSYIVHLINVPAGYTYDVNKYSADKDNKNVVINLYELSELTGEGTYENPYLTNGNAFNVTFTEAQISGMKYFSYTALEDGSYTIRSIAEERLATNLIDPYFGFIGNSLTSDMSKYDTSGNPENVINFSYTFEAKAGETYYFVVIVSSANSFPASFDIVVEK